MDKDKILEVLKSVKYPGYSRDIVSFGMVKDILIEDGHVRVIIFTNSRNQVALDQIREQIIQILEKMEGIKSIKVELAEDVEADLWKRRRSIPGIKHVIAIASGKGGVGKSTVTVNLAVALDRLGRKAGILDCDIYGPTVPLLIRSEQRPKVDADGRLIPVSVYNVAVMSIGFMIDESQPIIWRGPMVARAVEEMIFGVHWPQIDLLLIDLPPGTGDVPLTLAQVVYINGGIIVTTPQEVSVGIVRKGINMFQQVQVPVVGLIENMSYLPLPQGGQIEIFGRGGGRREAERRGIKFLGELPLSIELRESSDKGIPVLLLYPHSPISNIFIDIAAKLLECLG